MSPRHPRDIAASVRRRLLNLARDRREDFQLVLTTYATERLLYRLSRSQHADAFVLKGAVLFSVWTTQPHRITRDLDLLGTGTNDIAALEQAFRDVCATPVEEDGLRFDADTVGGEDIREEHEYGGVRIAMQARLGQARIPMRVDIGFGDAVTPGTEEIVFPTVLDFPAPRLRAYPRESVVAEKLHAMVFLGIANSRMKDFYDVWELARAFQFDGGTLRDAISATFARRRTEVPKEAPVALSPEFCADADKRTQWRAFIARNRLPEVEFGEVTRLLREFLMPPVLAVAEGRPFSVAWSPSRGWARARRRSRAKPGS